MNHVVAPPPATPSRWSAAFAAWGAMVGASFAALTIAYLSRDVVPGSITAWAGMLAIVMLGTALARQAFAERAMLLASVLALMVVPSLVAGAADGLSYALVKSWSYDRGGGDGGLGFVLAAILFIVCMLLVPLLAFALAWKSRPGTDLVMRVFAWAAIAATLGLAGAATLRAVRRPSPDGYLASLPLVVALDGEPSTGDPRQQLLVATGPGVRLARRNGVDCPFDVTLAEKDGRVLDQVFASGALSSCDKMGVRRDAANGYWIFTNENGPAPMPLIAVDTRYHHTVSINVLDVAPALSAPRAWIGLAAVGALAAIGWLVWGRRRLRPLRERMEGVEATHLGGGYVRLGDDAPPFVVDRAAPLAAGPVLLLGTTAASASAYRASGVPLAPREVVPGTRDAARNALASAMASHHALAFACALLAAAPLATAAVDRLVFP